MLSGEKCESSESPSTQNDNTEDGSHKTENDRRWSCVGLRLDALLTVLRGRMLATGGLECRLGHERNYGEDAEVDEEERNKTASMIPDMRQAIESSRNRSRVTARFNSSPWAEGSGGGDACGMGDGLVISLDVFKLEWITAAQSFGNHHLLWASGEDRDGSVVCASQSDFLLRRELTVRIRSFHDLWGYLTAAFLPPD